jgi:hypothetical protein
MDPDPDILGEIARDLIIACHAIYQSEDTRTVTFVKVIERRLVVTRAAGWVQWRHVCINRVESHPGRLNNRGVVLRQKFF